MSDQQATTEWDELPLGVWQAILAILQPSTVPFVRRVSKAWRDAFDAVNDTLTLRGCYRNDHLQLVARAAAASVVRNSPSLVAVSLITDEPYTYMTPSLTVSDLVAAGVASRLTARLRKLTGVKLGAEDTQQQLQDLQQCTSLTHLDIGGRQLWQWLDQQGHQGAAALTAALQGLGGLTYLRIGNCGLPPQHAAAIATALRSQVRLQQLHLPSIRICLEVGGLRALALAVSAMPELQTLDLCDIGLPRDVDGADRAALLCELLDAASGLTFLNVKSNRLHDDGAAVLAPSLQRLTSLRTLDLSFSDISDEGVIAIVSALAALPHLETLYLDGNEFGARGMSAVQTLWARQGTPLRKLDVWYRQLDPQSVCALAAQLRTASMLRDLRIGYSLLGDKGCVALAPAISCLGPSLKSLSLALAQNPRDRFGAAGATALAAALPALTGLTALTCYRTSTPVGPPYGIDVLAPALAGMRRLQVLNLRYNLMHAEGTAALAQVLPALVNSLTHLTLGRCHMDASTAASALAPALAQATGLVKLDLQGNDLGPQASQWLVPVLSALRHLRDVQLQDCKLGAQGCMAVAQALKDRDGVSVRLVSYFGADAAGEERELRNMSGINVFGQY